MKLRFLHRAWKARLRDQRQEIALAFALIRPGDTVVDAGANKGSYTYWLRKAVGPGGKALAFEPQPKLAQYLEEARARFNWANVTVREVALSDTGGTGRLHVPGGGVSPGASLEAVGGDTFECRVATLDDELAGRPVTFLKIDVEGHELALFRGAEQTLRACQPALLFECEARHLTKHTMQEVFDFLTNRGYDGYLLRRRDLLPIAEFRPETHQKMNGPQFWDAQDYYNNFLFCSARHPLP